jgi:hypothetical protein
MDRFRWEGDEIADGAGELLILDVTVTTGGDRLVSLGGNGKEETAELVPGMLVKRAECVDR